MNFSLCKIQKVAEEFLQNIFFTSLQKSIFLLIIILKLFHMFGKDDPPKKVY